MKASTTPKANTKRPKNGQFYSRTTTHLGLVKSRSLALSRLRLDEFQMATLVIRTIAPQLSLRRSAGAEQHRWGIDVGAVRSIKADSEAAASVLRTKTSTTAVRVGIAWRMVSTVPSLHSKHCACNR